MIELLFLGLIIYILNQPHPRGDPMDWPQDYY
jgi:hypothetical protein